ncbi:MAG: hypothetical protein R3200_04370 [Xanthomonadales bacterium]|nr:hypothetical protein [Xanthomonadales bacterium]
MTERTTQQDDSPGLTPDDVLQGLEAELSPRGRLATAGLMLMALAVCAAVSSLWLTEPGLPTRTHIGFGLIVVTGLCWSAYFGWVLSRKKVLYVNHRLAAGKLAVVFSSVFLLAALALALLVPGKAKVGFAAAGMGAFMLALAIALLVRAVRRYRALQARRRELEAELSR